MIGIIDYGLGNLFSLEKALKRMHIPYKVSSSKEELGSCDRFILSGVGHFEFGMQQLQQKDLLVFIHEQVQQNKRLLGICLGMQLLCTFSEEGNVNGLNLIDAVVKRIPNDAAKVPHIGWNNVYEQDKNPVFAGIDPAGKFYFTHSYAIQGEVSCTAGKTNYGGIEFSSAIHKDYVFGVQFHPEKSFDQGLQLLKNFAAL